MEPLYDGNQACGRVSSEFGVVHSYRTCSTQCTREGTRTIERFHEFWVGVAFDPNDQLMGNIPGRKGLWSWSMLGLAM